MEDFLLSARSTPPRHEESGRVYEDALFPLFGCVFKHLLQALHGHVLTHIHKANDPAFGINQLSFAK